MSKVEPRVIVFPAMLGSNRMISPPVVNPSAQRRDPIPESLVLVTVKTSPTAALGLSSLDSVGATGSPAQAPRRTTVSASGQRPARDANCCMEWLLAVEVGFTLLGGSPLAIEPFSARRGGAS